MGPPPKTTRTISQEAFDEIVNENMEALGMEPAEALQDAIQTLTLQGVDLSGSPPPNTSLLFPRNPIKDWGRKRNNFLLLDIALAESKLLNCFSPNAVAETALEEPF